MLDRVWALLPTIAVVGAVVMGLVEIAKDLFLRRRFYEREMHEYSSTVGPLWRDLLSPALSRLRVSQFVGQLGVLAQRAIDRPTSSPVRPAPGSPTDRTEIALHALLGPEWHNFFVEQVRNSPARNLESRADHLTENERPQFHAYSEARSAVLAALQGSLDTLQAWLSWRWRATVRANAVAVGMILCLPIFPYALAFSDRLFVAALQYLGVCLVGAIASGILAGIYHDILATIRSLRRDS